MAADQRSNHPLTGFWGNSNPTNVLVAPVPVTHAHISTHACPGQGGVCILVEATPTSIQAGVTLSHNPQLLQHKLPARGPRPVAPAAGALGPSGTLGCPSHSSYAEATAPRDARLPLPQVKVAAWGSPAGRHRAARRLSRVGSVLGPDGRSATLDGGQWPCEVQTPMGPESGAVGWPLPGPSTGGPASAGAPLRCICSRWGPSALLAKASSAAFPESCPRGRWPWGVPAASALLGP